MEKAHTIWIIDDDRSIRWVLEKTVTQQGMKAKCFESGDDVIKSLNRSQPDVVITDVRMPGINGLDLMEHINAKCPGLPVIIMTAHSDLESAVASYQGGAFEYLPKPFDIDEAMDLIHRAIAHTAENPLLNSEAQPSEMPEIIGEAPAMQEVFRAIGRLSHSNITVLINGESGTGKELVAQALHRHSPRASNPFIALNMAAIPKDLVESELFGHEKGAFTGASGQRQGRFEQAKGGTLFLDEIGDMPIDIQTRLLRVLADGEFYRVGGHTAVQADVRVIAATHQNLEGLVRSGDFREDLFHRLNVIRIHIPSLSERREDIPQLVKHFLRLASKELEADPKVLHPDCEAYLSQLNWPGNVRQLENLCRWLTVMAYSREVQISDLPPELQIQESIENTQTTEWAGQLYSWTETALKNGDVKILDEALPIFESTVIKCALAHTSGRKREAADLLGWGRNTLTRKLKELSIS